MGRWVTELVLRRHLKGNFSNQFSFIKHKQQEADKFRFLHVTFCWRAKCLKWSQQRIRYVIALLFQSTDKHLSLNLLSLASQDCIGILENGYIVLAESQRGSNPQQWPSKNNDIQVTAARFYQDISVKDPEWIYNPLTRPKTTMKAILTSPHIHLWVTVDLSPFLSTVHFSSSYSAAFFIKSTIYSKSISSFRGMNS